jgi:formate/nitrite transporter
MAVPHTAFPDAYTPAEMAQRVETVGVAKARADVLTTLPLAVLAGAFISLGALFFTVTITTGGGAEDVPVVFGWNRLLGGMAFSLGLILVVIGGAELFTGNNLIAMAWAAGRISTGELLRNWGVVYLGNFIGALGTAILAYLAGVHLLGDGAVGDTAVRIALAKTELSPLQAVASGILCNVLVCLAVWLCYAARSVTDKVLAILFPISAFVAAGFEHSVANMYFLPIGMLLAADGGQPIGMAGAAANLVLVTAGNIIGGTILVALVYWFVYLRSERSSKSAMTK